MDKKLLERCRDLEAQLAQDDSLEAENFREAEGELHSVVNRLDLLEMPGGVPKGYRELIEELDKGIHSLTLRGRVMRARYETLKDHVGELQDYNGADLHNQVVKLREEVEGLSDYDKAAIAVEREMHESKGSVKDVFKALLMWRDKPEEKLKEGSLD